MACANRQIINMTLRGKGTDFFQPANIHVLQFWIQGFVSGLRSVSTVKANHLLVLGDQFNRQVLQAFLEIWESTPLVDDCPYF